MESHRHLSSRQSHIKVNVSVRLLLKEKHGSDIVTRTDKTPVEDFSSLSQVPS